jgi:selenium-binding protein 1
MVMAECRRKRRPDLDKDFYIEFPKGYRSHQIRLEGGDCSTDSFCYPSV